LNGAAKDVGKGVKTAAKDVEKGVGSAAKDVGKSIGRLFGKKKKHKRK